MTFIIFLFMVHKTSNVAVSTHIKLMIHQKKIAKTALVKSLCQPGLVLVVLNLDSIKLYMIAKVKKKQKEKL